VLTNIHAPPPEGNFRDESGNPVQPPVIKDYNTYMGYAGKSDQIATSYDMCRRTWKWSKKLFLHLTDLVIVNALINHTFCGGIMKHKKFREQLIRDLNLLSYDQNITASGIAYGRPHPAATQLSRVEVKHSIHWPSEGNMRHCKVYSCKNQVKRTQYFC
jgi:hypothetical protein